MVTVEFARDFALSFDSAEERPHFEIISFRVKRKIFATLNTSMNRVCVKLSPVDQDVFCSFNNKIIYPVPNAWGKHGWTLIELSKVRKSMFRDAMSCSYNHIMHKKK